MGADELYIFGPAETKTKLEKNKRREIDFPANLIWLNRQQRTSPDCGKS
jgi:hypothetical protein